MPNELIRVLHERSKTPVIWFRVKRNPTYLENKIWNGEYSTVGEFGLHSSRWGFNCFHAFLRGNVERASEWPHSSEAGDGEGSLFRNRSSSVGSPFTSERVLDPALALHNTPLSSALPHLYFYSRKRATERERVCNCDCHAEENIAYHSTLLVMTCNHSRHGHWVDIKQKVPFYFCAQSTIIFW